MLTQSTRQRLLASSILIGAAAFAMSATGAAAQGTTQSPSTTPSGSSPQTNSIDPSQANSPAGTAGSPEAAGRPAVGAGGTQVQEITVTGSRIRQPNLTSTSPLTVVNAQELKLQGTTNVESLLNNLPSVTASQTEGISNGSSGTATVNLRNLGSQRTLVLVDGRRFPPSSSTAGVVDINNIPAALVDRVDVVTGGASAVYGADAVAGVVNFILKHDFQGLRIDAQFGFANHQNDNSEADRLLSNVNYLGTNGTLPKPGDIGADGFTYNITAILGANSPDGKGNVTAYAGYRNVAPVLQSTRDYSACGFSTNVSPDPSGTLYNQHFCGGSSNTAYGRFDNTGAIVGITGRGGATRIDNPDGTKTFVTTGFAGPSPSQQALGASAFAYNFDPVNYLQREDDQYRAGYFAHYKVAEWLDVYSDFMFMDDDTNAQIAPSGFFANQGPGLTNGFTFNCNNPLISAAQAAQLCPASLLAAQGVAAIVPGAAGGAVTRQSIRYRFATVPRNTNFRHDDYKIDIGARGDIGSGWHYDAYLQYGTSTLSQSIQNYASLRKLQNALNVVNNAAGQPVCTTDTTFCVPLDIFSSLGRNFTPAALNYVLVSSLSTAQSTEQIAHADIAGDLGQYGIKSPFADNGVGVAFGAEYRYEFLQRSFDDEQHTADLSGGGGQALDVKGNFDVYEVFAEVRAPLVENKPFIKDLSVDAGYRFSDYSTAAGTTDTYKFEANYSPTVDARVRFSYNRAVRAPNIIELFNPLVAGLGGYQDPCAGGPGLGQNPSLSQAQCALTGLSPALYNTIVPCASSQCEILSGGNPNLQPEIADTYSIGLVLTPRFLRNFTATVDYFNIDIQNPISGGLAGASTILNTCATTGSPIYCSLIHRDVQGTVNSSTGYVNQVSINAASLATRGIDFTANYRLNFSDLSFTSFIPGSLQIGYLGTYTQDLITQPVKGLGHYNCAGLFGPICGNPQPNYKHQMRFTWVTPWNATFSVNWRYIGNTNLDYNDANPFLQNFATVANGGSGLDLADARTGTYNYFDLAATYRFRDRYNFRLGVNNVFDKDPPLFDQNNLSISSPGNFGNGNTFPGVYDTLGRTVFVGLTADF